MPDILNWMVGAAEWFVGLFRKGAETFLSWMTGIVPLVLMLLIAMNSLIALIGEERINRIAAKAGRNVISRYLILPWIGAFFLTNPAACSRTTTQESCSCGWASPRESSPCSCPPETWPSATCSSGPS